MLKQLSEELKGRDEAAVTVTVFTVEFMHFTDGA